VGALRVSMGLGAAAWDLVGHSVERLGHAENGQGEGEKREQARDTIGPWGSGGGGSVG
jgi:hypothetical protein